MDLVKESQRWRKDATELLHNSKIEKLLGRFGKVTFTGSYVYDVMLGADIDLFVCHEDPTRKLSEDIAVALIRGGFWNSVMFCDWQKLPGFTLDPQQILPFGDYFCVKKDFNGARWKIDIFLVDTKELQKSLGPRNLYANFSQEQKRIILELKAARNKAELPPSLSSTAFYDAVLDHNVKSVDSD